MIKLRIISVILVSFLTLSLVLFSCDIPGADIYTPPNDEPGDNRSTLTGSVSIDKTVPQVGDTLTASYSGGNGSGTATWQWLQEDTAISDSNRNTYTVVPEDTGKTLKAQVSYANQKGSVTSDPTTAVSSANNKPTLNGTVAIDPATANVGTTLTASYIEPSNETGAGTGNPTWQWLRDNVAIPGASSATYQIVLDDAGTTLTARVSFASHSGSQEASVTVAGGVITVTSVDELLTLLYFSQPNTPDPPYLFKLNTNNIDDFKMYYGPDRYFSLDLSGSSMTTILPGGLGGYTTLTSITIPDKRKMTHFTQLQG